MPNNEAESSDEQIACLLRTAKESLGVSLAFFSRMSGDTQHFEVIEADVDFVEPGATAPRSESICQAILDERLPVVMPKLSKHREAKRLTAGIAGIRGFASVPVTLSDGSLYGTFCAAGFRGDERFTPRDQGLLEVLAQATAAVVEPEVIETRRRERVASKLGPLMDSGGPTVVVQPIVSLATGVRVGVEALSRFPVEWGQAPDLVFEEATSVGIGRELELLAVQGAAKHLWALDGYVAINFSAATLLDQRCHALLEDLPADRVLIELSEHDAVEDYDELTAALAPFRTRGMRLAIDDVGAGYSSLRHIVVTSPDVIKLDRSIVAEVAADPVLHTLVKSLTEFGHSAGASVVAEGIETAPDALVLRDLGVDYGQGWYFARAGAVGDLRDHYPVEVERAPEMGEEIDTPCTSSRPVRI